MNEPDPVDTVAPWTIKAVATKTREAVTNAARREGLTVGQWLERRVAEWEAEGSPIAVPGPTATVPGANLGELAQLIEATRALAESAVVAVPPSVAKDALSMVKLAIRQAKGLPPPAPRKKPPQAAIEG
jgi:hypothetical protein